MGSRGARNEVKSGGPRREENFRLATELGRAAADFGEGKMAMIPDQFGRRLAPGGNNRGLSLSSFNS